jgi:DNA-binding LacI/PurR family transcriptional regulator
VTIQEVARHAGTSVSTVSRVLSGKLPVASDKREAVLRSVAELNYRPNLLARSLKTRATQSLGLLINDILNPFYGALAKGVEDYASAAGYALMLCNTNEDPAREQAYLQMLRDKGIDGVIVAPTEGNGALLGDLVDSGIAVVQVDRRLPDLRASSVILDNQAGGYAATRHLIAQGHRRVCLVTYGLGQMTVVEREKGYRRALAEAGLVAQEADIARVPFGANEMPSRIARLFNGTARATALFVTNNRMAVAVLRTIKERGLCIPDDVALVIFDDLEMYALNTPTLTAVAQPAYAMGQKAAELLVEQLRSDQPVPVQMIVYQPELIVRESSGSPRLD